MIGKVDPFAIITLTLLYDPPQCCFTFSDFQFDPTLEEFERIFGRSLKKHNPFPKINGDVTPRKIDSTLNVNVQVVLNNWDTKGPFKAFSRRFLENLDVDF